MFSDPVAPPAVSRIATLTILASLLGGAWGGGGGWGYRSGSDSWYYDDLWYHAIAVVGCGIICLASQSATFCGQLRYAYLEHRTLVASFALSAAAMFALAWRLTGSVAASFVAGLPWGDSVEAVVIGERIGSASALKMCTGSVYKGLTALLTQAMRTAGAFDVLDLVVQDLERNGLAHSKGVTRSAPKAHRFVAEMREVAATQAAAGLTPDLFTAIADVYADIAGTRLAEGAPETAPDLDPAEIVARLRKP